MKKQTLANNLGALVAAVLVSLAATTQAQVYVINDNLDSYSGGTPGYSFGDVANATRNYVAGAGVGGSVGAVMATDFTPAGVGYGGLAYQYQSANTVGNTSANLSDYTLSFDALVNKAGGFSMTFQAWTGTGFGGTFSQSTGPDINIATPNVFQHYSLNLGTFAAGAVPNGGTLQIAWQMNEWQFGGPGTGNQMVIDNVQLQMVPEPCSLALAGLGGAALLGLRRRKG